MLLPPTNFKKEKRAVGATLVKRGGNRRRRGMQTCGGGFARIRRAGNLSVQFFKDQRDQREYRVSAADKGYLYQKSLPSNRCFPCCKVVEAGLEFSVQVLPLQQRDSRIYSRLAPLRWVVENRAGIICVGKIFVSS